MNQPQPVRALFKRDLLLAYRNKAELVQPLVFLIVIASLFPLAISPDPNALARLAPGAIWIAAVLTTVIGLDGIFRSDFEDGSIEQFKLSGYPLPLLALSKVFSHWLVCGLPLVLVAPLLAIWLQLPPAAIPVLVKSLLLGTPILSLIGAVGVALTVSLKRNGQLVSILVFPLYVPVLILATGAVSNAADGLGYAAPLGLLLAGLILALTLAPFAIATALKISLS